MNYKNTLNLPRTNFSMKANLTALEPKIISRWQNLDIYQRLRRERAKCDKYILHDGPPYANGLIHIGHVLNKILKDIIIKYKILRGYDCPFIIGWDCHGLPVEHQLFKELGLTKHDVKIVDFRKKAKDYALKFVNLQKKDFVRLGVFSDWDNPYLTLNPQYEYGVMKLLEYLVAEGYVYRGRRPVNWCGVCETALAEAEVEYLDKNSDSIYLLFPSKDDSFCKGNFIDEAVSSEVSGRAVNFLVWTTTPWTLVSNVAVAVHPQLDYDLVEFEDKLVILGKDLVPSLEKKFNKEFRVLKTCKGVDLEHLKLRHPFFDREARVVLADFISREEGSGCVHIAPGHGEEDFSLTKKYDLDIIMPVNDQGVFDEPEEFKGKNIEEASRLVLEKLREKDLLVQHDNITHSYPCCWRCKKPIIFRATFQWFLNVEHKELRKNLLAQTEQVKWVPSTGKERMKSMLVSRPDWCLSRQRLWGVPIPAVRCKACGEVTLNERIAERAACVFGEKGSDSWFTFDLARFIPSDFCCPNCGGKDFVKEFDILDVWFESGASFLAVLKDNPDLSFPADLYLEGSDQHRGWFQVSLIPSVAKENIPPYKTILTHGFVVDGEGRKMSKSLGNVIAPQEVSKTYGAEILRLWAAYSDYSEDIKISENIIKQLVDMYRKMRNTIRFIMGALFDFNLESNNLSFEELLEVDKFMIAKTALFSQEVLGSYENFSFYKVCQKIFNFCNLDLSSFYLDVLKDRLYTFSSDSKARRSAQFVLHHILTILLKVIAPILPFTAEEAYLAWDGLTGKEDSIFISGFDNNFPKEWLDDALVQRWEEILSLRGQVLKEIEKKREEGVIGSSLEAQVILRFKGKEYKFYSGYQDVLREIFIVSLVTVEEAEPGIVVSKAGGRKCTRCWNWSNDVGTNSEHPDICGRCSEALDAFSNNQQSEV